MRSWLGSLVALSLVVGCRTAPDCPPVSAPAVGLASVASPADEAVPEVPDSRAEATVILLVRHAEKASDGTDDPPLTERGSRRAGCLARLLRTFAPTHLLATQYRRTAATLEPLARATGLAVVVVEAQDEAAWTQALTDLPPGSRAVVAGHSNTLPTLVGSFGGRLEGLDAKGHIPHDDYDRLVHLVRDGERSTSYTTAYCTE